MRARSPTIRVEAMVEPWQYALIVGIAEVKGTSISSALRYLLKLSFSYLQQLADQGAIEDERLKNIIEQIRAHRQKGALSGI